MKTIDKFVLIPIERYNQLVRGGEFKQLAKGEGDLTKNQIVDSDITTDKVEKSHINVDVFEKHDTLRKGLGGRNSNKEDQKQIHLKEGIKKKKTHIRKKSPTLHFPSPPPGIRNKIRKNNVRWVELF